MYIISQASKQSATQNNKVNTFSIIAKLTVQKPINSFTVAVLLFSWALHPITHGPDFALKIMRIPLASGESRLVIIGAGYWDNKLYAVWTEGKRY